MSMDLRVIAYSIDEYRDVVDVRLESCGQRDGSILWAIRERGACLNKRGEWEFEPMPSSRTPAFFKRCRFKSAEAALDFWRKGGHKSRFEHYRTAADAAAESEGTK